jgi:hypothetical protein
VQTKWRFLRTEDVRQWRGLKRPEPRSYSGKVAATDCDDSSSVTVNSQGTGGRLTVSHPFWLILFPHCTTNVLLEYDPDDHLAKSPHPLWIPMIRRDVVVVGELVMTDCAYSVLFPDLPL